MSSTPLVRPVGACRPTSSPEVTSCTGGQQSNAQRVNTRSSLPAASVYRFPSQVDVFENINPINSNHKQANNQLHANQGSGGVSQSDGAGNWNPRSSNPLPPPPAPALSSPSTCSSSGVRQAAGAAGSASENPRNGNGSGEVTFNWQAKLGSVHERLVHIFYKEVMSDVHFVVGRGDQTMRIPAHKFVLSIGSAVFDAMFNGGMATEEKEIELPDVEPAAFISLLKFLYTDEVQIGPETVMTTLYTAKKYVVPKLEQQCVDFLKHNLSPDNAFMLLTQARLFDETALAQTCLETIDKTTVDASSADGFLEIDQDTLCAVLERDSLKIREVVLFNSVVRWAEAECQRRGLAASPENQRLVIGRALYLIRFPLMNIEEFASEVAQSGILTDREVVSMFLYYTVNPKPTVEFPDTPRSKISGQEIVMHRFSKTESRWGYSGTSDRIRFTVDRRIFLVGFGLYGSIHGPSTYDVTIQVMHSPSGKILATNATQFTCDGSSRTFRVLFKTPVEIQPKITYTACATLKGSDSHYGTEGDRRVEVVTDPKGGKKVTFEFQYAAGCNNGTSVEDGQIPDFIFYV